MKNIAVILADGCEEGETLTIVDILRRTEMQCDLVGLAGETATGAHGIVIRADKVLDRTVREYDMIVLPGGYGGAEGMRTSADLQADLKAMYAAGKFVTAMCAARSRWVATASRSRTAWPTSVPTTPR